MAWKPRACPEIRFWVAQATGLYRPATRRAERGSRPHPTKPGLWEEAASLFRSPGRPESVREPVALAAHFPDRL